MNILSNIFNREVLGVGVGAVVSCIIAANFIDMNSGLALGTVFGMIGGYILRMMHEHRDLARTTKPADINSPSDVPIPPR